MWESMIDTIIHIKHWVIFCFKILPIDILSLLKNDKDCNVMLMPPKAISALDIIVLILSEQKHPDKSTIPRVISILPFNIEDTISGLIV